MRHVLTLSIFLMTMLPGQCQDAINSTTAYVTPDDPPVFLCVGELDKKFRVAQMKRLAAQCEKVGLEHRLIVQPDMPHLYIPDPNVMGQIFSFFDQYLK